MCGIIIVWLVFGHKIQGMFSWTRWISEGSMACLLGVASGIALLAWDLIHGNRSHGMLSFDSAMFFTYLLPPIIFYGGLAMRRRLFVSNLLSIAAFGILGTFVSFAIIGSALYYLSLLPNVLSLQDCFALAAIFAATDSVAVLQVLRPESHPTLYSLVLGEGVLNDATSVALLRSTARLGPEAALTPGTLAALLALFAYVFAASLALGLGGGLAIAAVMKHLGPFSQPQEAALVGALAFLTYLLAELTGLSGILALFFCGMAVNQYALQHVARPSAAALLNAFRTLAYLLEGLILLYVGRDALDPIKWANAHFLQTLYLVLVIIVLVAVSRAVFVFPLAWLHNRWSMQPLSVNEGVVVWWAGMMRGAVSTAMVYQYNLQSSAADSHAATIVVTTLQVVLYSTVGLGGITGPLLKVLLPYKVSPPDVTGAQLHDGGGGGGGNSGGAPSHAGSPGYSPMHSAGFSPRHGHQHSNGAFLEMHRGRSDELPLFAVAARDDTRRGGGSFAGFGEPPLATQSGAPGAPWTGGAGTKGPASTGLPSEEWPPAPPVTRAALEMRTMDDRARSGLPVSRPREKPFFARNVPPKPPPDHTDDLGLDVSAAASAMEQAAQQRRMAAEHMAPTSAGAAPLASGSRDTSGDAAVSTGGATLTRKQSRGGLQDDGVAMPAGPPESSHPAAAGVPARMQDVGTKMLSAARSFAQLTNFEGPPAGGGTGEGAVGVAMYARFKQFDQQYLQPVFGKDGEGAEGSAELSSPLHSAAPPGL